MKLLATIIAVGQLLTTLAYAQPASRFRNTRPLGGGARQVQVVAPRVNTPVIQPTVGVGQLQQPRMLQQQPQQQPQIEVLIAEGSGQPGGIAPELRTIQQLSGPPFNAYSRIAFLGRETRTLTSEATTVPLPNNNSAAMRVLRATSDGQYQIAVEILVSGRRYNTVFRATVGQPFFAVYSLSTTSALILGFTVH